VRTSPSPSDPATSEFYKDGVYDLKGEGRTLSSLELADYWWTWPRLSIVSIEDGMPRGMGRLGRSHHKSTAHPAGG